VTNPDEEEGREEEEEGALGTRPGRADHRDTEGGDARMAKKKAKKTKKK
jgi:hypothetical protein